MEWFKVNAQTVPRDVGLAGNDISVYYPLLSLILCMVYYYTNKPTVIGDYFQGEEEYEKNVGVKVIGQMGLRYFTTAAAITGVYNESTPADKNYREERFVSLMRLLSQKNLNDLSFKANIVSGTSRSASDEIPKQNKDIHNTDCERDIPQTSWWKAKYTVNGLSNKTSGKKEMIPLAYLLDGTDSNGTRIRLYGFLKTLSVEVDRDILSPSASIDGVAWKMTMELVDTNWNQSGGVPGKNRIYKFVCSQQVDKCVFSSLVGSDGKPFNIFVSRFLLRYLGGLDASVTSPSIEYLLKASNDTLSLHPDKSLMLSYSLRSLPLLDNTIVSRKDKKKNILLMGGVTSKTQLPLEIHIRSPEPLNDKGDLFVAYPVLRVMIRYVSTPPEAGNMQPDQAAIRSIQFLLPNDRILAQDTTDKKKWMVNDTVLHRDSTIDLLFLNKTPIYGTKSREPGMHGGAKGPAVGGQMSFRLFTGIRQAYEEISIDMRNQESMRMSPKYATQSWNNLRAKDNNRANFSRFDIISSMWKSQWTSVIVIMNILALLLGWRYASREGIERVSFIVSRVCTIMALAVFILSMMEINEKVPDTIRPYEMIVYYIVLLLLFMASFGVLYSVRFVPEMSASLYTGMLVVAVSAIGMACFQTRSPVPMSPASLGLKVGLMLVLAVSLQVMAIEIRKTSKKALIGFAAQPLKAIVGNLPNVAFLFSLVMILLGFVVIGLNFLGKGVDSCSTPRYLYDRAKAMGKDSGEIIRRKREYDECIMTNPIGKTGMNILHNNYYRDWVPLFLVCIPLYFFLASSYIGGYIGRRYPSRMSAEGNPEQVTPTTPAPINRIEDGRMPRGVWVVKTILGIAMLYGIASLVMPYADWNPGVCTSMRKMELDNRNAVTRKNHLKYDSVQWMTQVHDSEWRYDCIPQSKITLILVMGCTLSVLLLSFSTSAKHRFIETRVSAIDTMGKFIFLVVLWVGLIWVLDEDNRIRMLQIT